MLYQTILPSELAERLQTGEKINLIDVREPLEHEIASIQGAKLLPLSQFNEWIDDLKPDEEIIVMCHHGIRSQSAAEYFLRHGFRQLYNLQGGIDDWSRLVDQSVARY